MAAIGPQHAAGHRAGAARHPLAPPPADLLRVGSRRWFLQTGLAGLAGLSLPDAVRLRAAENSREPRAVILFWLSGGPSQIDTWDPKPDAPAEVRGPYRSIATSVPGVRVCEHLPLQARLMHKLTLLRAVDCSASNHTPITMQAGNALARRTDDNKDGGGYRRSSAWPTRGRPTSGAPATWVAPTSRSRATSCPAGSPCRRRCPSRAWATATRCAAASTGCSGRSTACRPA
jgi:hypothetical protein